MWYNHLSKSAMSPSKLYTKQPTIPSKIAEQNSFSPAWESGYSSQAANTLLQCSLQYLEVFL